MHASWETTVALARILDLPLGDAQQGVQDHRALAGIQVIAVPPKAADAALDAFDRDGTGRHPAGLNFGDCFAYACARTDRVPLLFKGDGFPLTDVQAG
ncbi:type II toxin-antitoxin system VapC family toxin [Methylobacterium sp. ID0610]|uniref:type II toxin-antitoxin system VapC family toxin n=1 Tax=Methylobacterium carpenticola TaxID=3344827 RepID=UPI0036A42FCA